MVCSSGGCTSTLTPTSPAATKPGSTCSPVTQAAPDDHGWQVRGTSSSASSSRNCRISIRTVACMACRSSLNAARRRCARPGCRFHDEHPSPGVDQLPDQCPLSCADVHDQLPRPQIASATMRAGHSSTRRVTAPPVTPHRGHCLLQCGEVDSVAARVISRGPSTQRPITRRTPPTGRYALRLPAVEPQRRFLHRRLAECVGCCLRSAG